MRSRLRESNRNHHQHEGNEKYNIQLPMSEMALAERQGELQRSGDLAIFTFRKQTGTTRDSGKSLKKIAALGNTERESRARLEKSRATCHECDHSRARVCFELEP